MPRGSTRDPLADLPPDARIAARKAQRWLTGGIWATSVGYSSAWLVDKFSAFGLAVFAVAIATQVVCFALWWHYMGVMDAVVEKFVLAQGISMDVPHRPGWRGFVERHPTLSGLALGVVLLGVIVALFVVFDG